jgi:hypothetical protein
MVATYAAIAWGLVFFSNRFLFVGEIIVRSPHYSADLVPVMVLGAAFLVTRTVLDDGPPLRRAVPPQKLVWVRRGVAGHLVLVCVATTITTGRVWDRLEPTSPEPYLDTLLAEAHDMGRADVYDTRVPAAIVNPVFLEDGSTVSAVVRPLELPLTFNAPTERYAIVNDDGHFRAAAVVGGHANDGPGPDGECGYAVDAGQVTKIPMTGEFFSFEWVMELTYFTGAENARVSVRTDDDQVDLDLPAPEPGTVGKRQLTLSGAITSLSVEGLEGDTTVCVTEVRIGLIEPTDEVPAQLED